MKNTNTSQVSQSSQSALPWYHVKHRGGKLQTIWQLAIGSTLLAGLVIAPLVIQLRHNEKNRQNQLNHKPSTQKAEDMMQLVRQKRLQLRREALDSSGVRK